MIVFDTRQEFFQGSDAVFSRCNAHPARTALDVPMGGINSLDDFTFAHGLLSNRFALMSRIIFSSLAASSFASGLNVR